MTAEGTDGTEVSAQGQEARGQVEDATEEPRSPAGAERKDAPDPERWTRNRIGVNHGKAVNAGRIDGGVHYHEYIGERTTSRLRQAARVSAERVREVRATFCPSDRARYETFEAKLRVHRTGIITGHPGSGRAFTAVHALDEARPGAPIEELTIDPGEKDAGISLISVDSDHSRFLDLTPLPRPTAAQQVALRGLVEDARGAGALLVIITGSGRREEFLAEHPAWLHIDAPALAGDVFRLSMTQRCGGEAAERWLSNTAVLDFLDGAEPTRALRLAQEADRSRDGHQKSEEDEELWIKKTLRVCSDATDELAQWFNRHEAESEFNRVLLATVALLEGGTREAIVRHAHRLAGQWHIPPLWRTPISGEGLTKHLLEIGARVCDGRIHFTRRGHGDDVLDYLWREHPGTRQLVQEWAAKAVSELDGPRKIDAAQRWLRLARRQRDIAPVRALIERWGDSGYLMWAAAPVIAEAAVTPELGAQVRSALYRVAIAPKVNMRDRTVLEACRVYGRIQPSTALTRIRRIAEKVPHYWDGPVVEALKDIAGEPDNTIIVLEELLTWAKPPERGRRTSVAGLALCQIMHDRGGGTVPVVVTDLHERRLDRDVVVQAWRAASRSAGEVGRPLWAWFDVLEGGSRHVHGAFETLRRAADDHQGLSRAMVRTAGRWKLAHAHTKSRTPVLDDLLHSLKERENERGNELP